MKKILFGLLIMIITTTLSAQLNCDDFIIEKYDKMTDVYHTKAIKPYVLSSKLTINLKALPLFKDILVMHLETTNLGCMNEETSAIFLFRNKDRLRIKNILNEKCRDEASLWIGGNFTEPRHNHIFRNQTLETIRVINRDGEYEDFEIPYSVAVNMRNTIDCLLDKY